MEKIEGNKLEQVETEDKDKYSYLMAKFGIKCILYDSFYHADMHQGNVFIY